MHTIGDARLIMGPESFLYTGILFFLSAASASLMPLPKKQYLFLLSCLGALSIGIAGFSLVSAGKIALPPVPVTPDFQFAFSGDSLAGFFLSIISILTFAVSVFSIGYVKDFKNKGSLVFLYNIFIVSMYAVVLSENIFTFLVSWETMTVISYFLVTFDRNEKSAKAGLVYAVMSHIGTAFIVMLFLLLYTHTGSMEFSSMRAASLRLPEQVKTIIFVCSIIGFGTKAGIIPFHTWLPKAHPAAPSNISALMSGVMIKTGIYGFIRISMDILGQGPEWWGITVLVIGAVSSVIGVLYALMEHDLKKLLAYHSIENIGIILLGVGSSMMFRSNGLYVLSAIALTAGLYHTVNHAIFKGLLFLGAGSLVHATHTKNMEDMGGLIKSMPYTGLFFLIGSVSICALPPFNGFVSEWLTYQALLLGFQCAFHNSKDALSSRRGSTGPYRRPGRCMFCKGIRHNLSRNAEKPACAGCKRVVCIHDCRDGDTRGTLPSGRNPPGHGTADDISVGPESYRFGRQHSLCRVPLRKPDVFVPVSGCTIAYDVVYRYCGRCFRSCRRRQKNNRLWGFMGLRYAFPDVKDAVYGNCIYKTDQVDIQKDISAEKGASHLLYSETPVCKIVEIQRRDNAFF